MFHFKDRNWEFFEAFRPYNIADALRTTLERLEEAIPGTLAKAAKLDGLSEWNDVG